VITLLRGDCTTSMKALPDKSVNCCVTSPPYYGLRDYGVEGQAGLESTPEEYIANMVKVFSEVKRVLRDDGTLWLNIGDSYAANRPYQVPSTKGGPKHSDSQSVGGKGSKSKVPDGLKPKDLIGIPWALAFALRADGWYLRQDIIWCLSGGTWLYVRTKKGDMPMMLKDINRLDPATVKLWNGDRWTQLLGISKSERKSDEIEIVLRSGERISCTPTHKFPTTKGLVTAAQLKISDKLVRVLLPEPENIKDCVIDEDAAWLAGLYIAEGSMSEDTIQIAGHVKETGRWERLQAIAKKFGGTAARSINGNCMDIRLYGKVLVALINELVTGKTAIDKGFNPVVWKYSNLFLNSMLDGYLQGDGHWDQKNSRWRLGFCRNYNLERDLRTCCSRIGAKLILKMSSVKYQSGVKPIFKGEIRFSQSSHKNIKDENEIVGLRKARCRYVYDIGVEDEPHLFALASGILTHNSKPNPMPESVKDRCTKSHEYIFLFSKKPKYYFDSAAMQEPAKHYEGRAATFDRSGNAVSEHILPGQTAAQHRPRVNETERKALRSDVESRRRSSIPGGQSLCAEPGETRNKRSVWTVSTKPCKLAHFATFPPDLIEPCILAGCPEGGTVIDPFGGSGTVAGVAVKHNRKAIICELNSDYHKLIPARVKSISGYDMFADLC